MTRREEPGAGDAAGRPGAGTAAGSAIALPRLARYPPVWAGCTRARSAFAACAGLSLAVLLGSLTGCAPSLAGKVAVSPDAEAFFTPRDLTPPGSFTSGAEGPAVDHRDGSQYAVSYERGRTIGRITPAGAGEVFLELPPGSTGNGIRFDSAGDMLVADYTGHKVLRVDVATRALRVHAHEPRMNQPNDVAVAADDRVYASDPRWADGTGQLWRVNPDGTVTLLETGMGTTNGIEVGPDQRVLYVNESVQRRVWAYDLSPEGGISRKRLLIAFDDFGLDGMRCDVDGNLYITRHGKGTLAQVSPAGELLREIRLAGGKPTNVAFGGPDGRTLYVTVADRGNVEVLRVDRPGWSWELAPRRGQAGKP